MKKSFLGLLAGILALGIVNTANAASLQGLARARDSALEAAHITIERNIPGLPTAQERKNALYQGINENLSPKYTIQKQNWKKINIGSRLASVSPYKLHILPGSYTQKKMNGKESTEYIIVGTCSTEDILNNLADKAHDLYDNRKISETRLLGRRSIDVDVVDAFYCVDFINSFGERHLVDYIEHGQDVITEVEEKDLDNDGFSDVMITIAHKGELKANNYRIITYRSNGEPLIQNRSFQEIREKANPKVVEKENILEKRIADIEANYKR